MTVGVESRHEQHSDLLEHPRHGAAENLTQRNETGILTVALAGVNATLKHEQRHALTAQILRRPRTETGPIEIECYLQRN